MVLLADLKNSFTEWYQKIKLSLVNKSYSETLLRLPSDSQDDYYYDQLQQTWIFKDKTTQIGFHNVLYQTKVAIESMEVNINNLQAIIANISNINTLNSNIDGNITSLTAIIANIGTMNINIANLQSIITDIANIETLNTNISGNIDAVNTNIGNLQAIITDIANIETLNTNIDGNITSLTAIIANIGTINTNINNLQAIISDIGNIETINTTISGNIATVNTNINNLQAIITDIENIETLSTTISGNITSLTAIIANIGTMNTNIGNLQAIISDIANIETLNTTISGNITSLTAIIANIGTMNTNIGNLQAIISDIANIETQNILMETSLATINTNIGTINTALTDIKATNADIDIHIDAINTLDIDISEQVNKSLEYSGTIGTGTETLVTTINSEYLYNSIVITMKANDNNNAYFEITLKNVDNVAFLSFTVIDNTPIYFNDYNFTPSNYIKVYIGNWSGTATIDYNVRFFYSRNVKPNEYTNIGRIVYTESHIFEIYDIGLLNRLSYSFYKFSSAQSYDIEIYAYMIKDGAETWIEILNKTITGSASESLTDTIAFNPMSKLKVFLHSDSTAPSAYFYLNLFFSKKTVAPDLEHNSLSGLNDGTSYEHLTQTYINIIDSLLHSESHTLGSHSEKLHASLASVLTSQHHIKTVSSEINLNNLAEKLHASLASVSTSQHHTKYTNANAVSAMGAKADDNPLNHDKGGGFPYFTALQIHGTDGFVIYRETWQVVHSDLNARYNFTLLIPVTGSYKVVLIHGSSLAGRTDTGSFYCYQWSQGGGGNSLFNVGFSLVNTSTNRFYHSKSIAVNCTKGYMIKGYFSKNNNPGSGYLRMYGVYLELQ